MVPEPQPSVIRWVLGFLLVGAAWGLTTPFMRSAALVGKDQKPPDGREWLDDPATGFVTKKIWSLFYAVTDLLRRPAYAIPLVVNLTGSLWFFLLIGHAEMSLMVPITNSLAFMFTVLGEWWAEGKVISKNTWTGMGLVLGGIALCVHSKNT
ncbi:hypothetical protein K461DRAFT_105670 [Myriangium duriaei CBS 260.36]|uniref:Uncharacterized protein n=1 Tax=Myriangium duriaei CBS 260.36 TaxID=1168546 RepID=A0A9P4MPU5_9PEZI|nr:hypothetical protein K461DRAFT_105670 [Myriangium duriaei CBS 260.36]